MTCESEPLFRIRNSQLKRITRNRQIFLSNRLNAHLRCAPCDVVVVRVDLFNPTRRCARHNHPVEFELGVRNIPLCFTVPGLGEQQCAFSRGSTIKRNNFKRAGIAQFLNILIPVLCPLVSIAPSGKAKVSKCGYGTWTDLEPGDPKLRACCQLFLD